MTALILNDYYLHSFVDAQLSPEESSRVWQAILTSPLFRQKHEMLIEQQKLLRRWWNSLSSDEQTMAVRR